jgi:hypothetical protein
MPFMSVLSCTVMKWFGRLATLCFVVNLVAAGCHASLLYSFNYTATSAPFESFSFSLDSLDSVASGESPVFSPFVITDGTNQWTITEALVWRDSSDFCLMLGTNYAILGGPAPFVCSVGVGGPGDSNGGFEVNMVAGSLPSSPGVYPASTIGSFDSPAGSAYIESGGLYNSGTIGLVITSSVPEPSTFAMAFLFLVSLIGTRCFPGAIRRLRQCGWISTGAR